MRIVHEAIPGLVTLATAISGEKCEKTFIIPLMDCLRAASPSQLWRGEGHWHALASLSKKNQGQPLVPLYLQVSVNGAMNSQLLPFFLEGKGQILGAAKTLRKLRVKVSGDIADATLVKLSDLPGVTYQYDESNQQIRLRVPAKGLTAYAVDLKGNAHITSNDLLNFTPITAGILNYNFYNTNTDDKNTVSVTGEALLSSRLGNFSNSFVYNSDTDTSYAHDTFTRLETRWQYIDPVNIRSYVAGDFINNSPDWSGGVRMAGLQWSSAYKQRSDLITTALPQFSGSAAVPTSLDLYVNQQRIFSGAVPSGPFDLKALPYISGNNVTLVMKDASGHDIVSTQSFYYSAKILSPGVTEFSLDAGVPRNNYGTQSDDYDSVLFSSGAFRTGITREFTVSGNAQSSSDGMLNAGGGVACKIFERAVVSANAAGSTYKSARGSLLQLGLDSRLSRNVTFNANWSKTFDQYYDLPRVSSFRYLRDNKDQLTAEEEEDYLHSSSLTRESLGLGLSWNFLPGYSASVQYNNLNYEDDTTKIYSLSVSAGLTQDISVYASAFRHADDTNDYGVYFGLTYVPSVHVTSTASVSNDNGSMSYRETVTGRTSNAIGGVGWGVSAVHDDSVEDKNQGSAFVNYRAHPAFLQAQYDQSGNDYQLTLSAKGSIVAAGGSVFAANEVGDAFAVVKGAGPGSRIYNEGVDLGPTDGSGDFFIARLTPYTMHKIHVNSTNLPLDWEADTTEKRVISGYRQGSIVDFGAHQVIAATVLLVDTHQKPIPPGYTVRLQNGPTTVVGYDGEVYVQQLQKENEVTVDLLDKGSCRARFSYNDSHSSIKKLGPYICQ